jgi:hypothetical protein
MSDKIEAGRLALRIEGEFWNAYFAASNTMENAFLLGSIRIAAVADNPERKQAFIKLMSDFTADVLEKIIGVRPDAMKVQTAPQHERSGNA